MDAEEINGLLWDTLAHRGGAHTAAQVALAAGLSFERAQASLARLRQANLVTQIPGSVPAAYRVELELDALRWARAIGLGVGLLSLERHAHLPASARAEALRLATDGSIERLEQADRNTKRRHREAVLRGRAASQAAASDLAKILQDTQRALTQATPTAQADPRQQAVALLLEQANQETTKALNDLIRSLHSK